MNPETKLQEALKQFECQRCQECCKKPGMVYLKPGEAEHLAQFFGLSEFDFVNQYCDLQDRQKLVLKKKADEACVFLTDTGCQVHEVKPEQCREFPVKWRTPASFDYCEGLKRLAGKFGDLRYNEG